MALTKPEYAERDRVRRRSVQRAVAAAVACELCPGVTAEHGLAVLTGARPGKRMWRGTPALRDAARELLDQDGRRERILEWIDAFNRDHGHGPAWRQLFKAPGLWAEEMPMAIQQCALAVLTLEGRLDGMKTPYSMCLRTAESGPVAARQRTADTRQPVNA